MTTTKQKRTVNILGSTNTGRFIYRFNIPFTPKKMTLKALSVYIPTDLTGITAEAIYVVKANGLMIDNNILHHFVVNTTRPEDVPTTEVVVNQTYSSSLDVSYECVGNLNGNDIEFYFTNIAGNMITMSNLAYNLRYALTIEFES